MLYSLVQRCEGPKECKSGGSRQELSNVAARLVLDSVENESLFAKSYNSGDRVRPNVGC